MKSTLPKIPDLDEVTIGSSNDTLAETQGHDVSIWPKPRKQRVRPLQELPSPFKGPGDAFEEMPLSFAHFLFWGEDHVYSTPKASHLTVPLISARMIPVPDTSTKNMPVGAIKLKFRPRRQGLSNTARLIHPGIFEDRAKAKPASITEHPFTPEFVFKTPKEGTKTK